MTKKVLIVCDTFPPLAHVGGIRPAMFCKYLPRFGWEPYVFSRDWPPGDEPVPRTQSIPGLDMASRIYRVAISQADEARALRHRTWYDRLASVIRPEQAHPPGVAARMLCELSTVWPKISFDACLATVPDLWPLRVADLLYRERGIPWIGDLRDIVEQEWAIAGGWRERLLMRRMRRRRNALLRCAAQVLVVSEHHAEIMVRQVGGKVSVIYNGYDPDVWENGAPLSPTDYFGITYAGRLLSSKRSNPRLLFLALNQLIAERVIDAVDLRLTFLGSEPELVLQHVADLQWLPRVDCKERLPYVQVAEVLKRSCVLLVLVNPSTPGVMTTKLFEYLPIGRPVLVSPGDSAEVDALVASTGVGRSCATVEATKEYLGSLYAQWKKDGNIRHGAPLEKVRAFSRQAQAGALAQILDGITAFPRQAETRRGP